MIEITPEPILPEEVISQVKKDDYGAVVTFIGMVRGYSKGERVISLEYEAYEEMAQKKLHQIANEVKDRWQLPLAIYHRTGKLKVGEIVVVIAVAAPHRKEAFEACQYAIDRIKEIAPIWKKEVVESGELWVG